MTTARILIADWPEDSIGVDVHDFDGHTDVTIDGSGIHTFVILSNRERKQLRRALKRPKLDELYVDQAEIDRIAEAGG